MTFDLSISAYGQRLQVCRQADLDREALITEVVSQYESLKVAHRTLLEDFANEQERRRMWQNKVETAEQSLKFGEEALNDLRRHEGSCPFVVIILDGDGAIFRDDLYQKGKEGGRVAASLLEKSIRAHLRSTYPDQSTQSWSIMAYLFLNSYGLANALMECNVIQHHARQQLAEFGHAFGSANPLFNYIDVGNGKERADHKARETLRAFMSMAQCKHIFFGPCNDNGYIPVLEPHSLSDSKKRVTLVETRPAGRGFKNLRLEIKALNNIFRTTNLQKQPHTLNDSNDYGVTLGAPPKSPAPSGVASSSCSYMAIANKSGEGAASSWVTVVGKVSSKERAAMDASSRPSPNHQRFILLNVDNERLDPELPKVSTTAMASLDEKRRTSCKNFCNHHHMFGSCLAGKRCAWAHGPRLPPAEQNVLKHKARGSPCFEGSECREFLCYNAHQCKFGDSCTMPECKMEAFHSINTTPYRKLFEDGTGELIRGGLSGRL